MQVRQLWGIAVLFGALSAVGGPSAQASQSNSLSFVRLLLLREAQQIFADDTAIARQNNDERLISLLKVITPTSGRQARQIQSQIAALQRNSVLLQARIDNTTSSLLNLNSQLTATLASLGNPSPFAQQAAANAAVIAVLAARPPFGIPPVTGSQ